MQVLDLVVIQVALVDAVEALDVGVALVLEVVPVERSRLLNGEAVGFGVVDGFGEGGGVVCDLLGNAARWKIPCMSALGPHRVGLGRSAVGFRRTQH